MKEPSQKKAEKALKKQKKMPLPSWGGAHTKQSGNALFMNVAIRTALLCAATAGVALLFVQLYQLPVDVSTVILWTVFASLLFNTIFLFLKFRYALPLFGLAAYLYIRMDDVLFNLGCLADYLFYFVDGDRLRTAGFARRSYSAAFEYMSLMLRDGLQRAVILVCVVFALLFALSARGKFIGPILITAIMLLIPTLAAQKATFVPAMVLLAVSMMGLYSMWVSQEQGYLKSAKPRRLKDGFFIPAVHRQASNGVIAAIIALIASITAQSILPAEKTNEIIEFWKDSTDNVIEFAYDIGESLGGVFGGGIPSLEHSGFMPSGSIDAPGSLSINNPTLSRRHIMNVTVDNNDAPIYLRNGIGAVFNPKKGEWDVNSGLNRMKDFPDGFYPEHEYLIFRQKVGENSLGHNADDYIGRQWVDVEYLVRTRHVMLPTSLYFPGYKTDDRFKWTHDAILEKRGSTGPQTYSWNVLYPKKDFSLINNTNLYSLAVILHHETLSENALTAQQAEKLGITDNHEDYIYLEFNNNDTTRALGLPYAGALRIFADQYGLTAAEFLAMREEYEKMVYETYTITEPSETENMHKLWEELGPVAYYLSSWSAAGVTYSSVSPYNNLAMAQRLELHFTNNYNYSLTADNNQGSNTMLGNFLFETREGHCALYATAMTLALRELGIPARYVTGYVTNHYGGSMTADGRYQHTILARDLHAWVEVYQPGVGWLPFDPTPPIYERHFVEAEAATGGAATTTTTPRTTTPRPETTTRPTPTTTTPTPTSNTETVTTPKEGAAATTTPEPAAKKGLPPEFYQFLRIMIIVILAGGLILATVMFFRAVNKAERKRLAKYEGLSERDLAREAYRFIMRILKIAGLSAQPGETPVKFAVRADEAIQLIGLSTVIDIIEKLEFSREELSEQEYERLAECLKGLYQRVITDNKAFRRFARKIAVLGIIK